MNYYHRYVRHSASSQEQMHSRDAQIREIAEYVKRNPARFDDLVDAGEYYDEEISGGMAFVKRPAGGVLLERCKSGDHIVVARFDRMCRQVKDLEWMMEWCAKQGVTLHIIDSPVDLSTAMGVAFLQIRAVFAQLERGTCSERQRKTNQMVKHTKGIAVCLSQPIGWRRVRNHKELNTLGHPYATLVQFGPERDEAREITKLYDQGMWPQNIANLFNERRRIPVRYRNTNHKFEWSAKIVRARIKACKAGFPAPPDCVEGRNTEQLTIEVQR